MDFFDIVTYGRCIEAPNDYGREFYSDSVESLDAPERIPSGSTRRCDREINGSFLFSRYTFRGE